jgi:hypothetical protein
MSNDPMFSRHIFRSHVEEEFEPLPVTAPEGRLFYLVTPSPKAPPTKKRYLHDAVRDRKTRTFKITLTHSRQLAKKFDNLRLIEGLADLLANPDIVFHEHDFWVVLEPEGYKEEVLTRKKIYSPGLNARA